MSIKTKIYILLGCLILIIIILQDPYFKKHNSNQSSIECIDGISFIVDGAYKRKMTGVNGGDRIC
jgi:hypothetical protein